MNTVYHWIALIMVSSLLMTGCSDEPKRPGGASRQAGKLPPAPEPTEGSPTSGPAATRPAKKGDLGKDMLDFLVKNDTTRFAADVSPDMKLVTHIVPDRDVTKRQVLARFGEPDRRTAQAKRSFARLPDAHGGLRKEEVEGEVWEYGSTALMFQDDRVTYAWMAVALKKLREFEGQIP